MSLFMLILFFYSSSAFIKKIIYPVAFAAIIIVLMLPWTIRNYQVFNRLIILTPRTSEITDKLIGYENDEVFYKSGYIQGFYLSENHIDSVLAGTKNHFSTGKQISDQQIQAMKKEIIPYEFGYTESLFSNFKELWEPVDFINDYTSGGYKFNPA